MKLKPLDIIIFEGIKGNVVDEIIMHWSDSAFVHCVVVKNEQGDIWDANIGGILNRNISDYPQERYRTVRRYKTDLAQYEVDRIIEWINAKQKIAHGYDYLAWLGFATGIEYFEDEERWYCSELPYWMFQDNGYKLTEEELTFVYPDFFIGDERWFGKERLFLPILWQDIEL